MTVIASRNQRRLLEKENAKQPTVLREVPRDQWPDPFAPVLRLLRSRDFLVQIHQAKAPADVRISVNHSDVVGGEWRDGITWEELQRIKRECGYGDRDAVEVFPSDIDVVNVANMRHLWVMLDPVSFAWRPK